MHSLGLIGSSKLTAKSVVIALAAGLLGAGVAVISPAEPANATSCSSAATGYADGSGDGTSTATAFRISTSADLIRLSTTSTDWTGKFFIQTADIDLGGCEWSPIGRPLTPFTGFYNGGGKVISGLSITTATPTYLSETLEEVGMFAEIRNSRIENLTLRGNISIPATSGLYFVGSLVGLGTATGGFTTVVSKVRSEVSITTTNLSATGGIVGEFGGTMEYSSFVGSMQVNASSGSRYSGGLSGWLRALSKIENSYARVSYSGTSTLKTGINGRTAIPIRKSYSASSGVNAAFVDSGPSSGLLSINSFWDSDLAAGVNPQLATSNSLAGVTGETTASMKSISTFSSGSDAWDIVEGWEPFSSTSSPAKIWGICSLVNDGYPFLLWEYTTDPCTVAPPPSSSGSGSSGSVYVAPIVVPEVVPVVPSTIRQPTIRQATDDKPARLLGRSLDKDVLFIADSARLSPEAKKSLRQAARLAMASDGKVAVTGFAAMTGRGSAFEKSVAQKRALAVARYLRSQGFDDWIYYQGLSGRKGLAFDGDPRRVEIRILK